jgi:transposase
VNVHEPNVETRTARGDSSLTLKNLSVAEIATELHSVYGRDALKYSTVPKWRLRFQDGSEDLFDSARSGRPARSDLAAPIQSLLQQFHSSHVKYFVAS